MDKYQMVNKAIEIAKAQPDGDFAYARLLGMAVVFLTEREVKKILEIVTESAKKS